MRIQSALFIAIAVLGVGCSKPADTDTAQNTATTPKAASLDVVGKYEIDPTTMLSGDAKKDDAIKTQSKTMAMELKADKSFAVTTLMAGTYDLSGTTLTLTTTKLMGKDVNSDPKMKEMAKPEVAT